MTYQEYLEGKKLIVTAALTGGVHGKNVNADLPEQPEEIAAEARACEEAGASIVHLHGRDEHGENSAARLQAIDDAVRAACDDVIVQNTTGGQATLDERVKGIRTDPAPEMASLDMGPFNRGDHIITQHTRANITALAEEMAERGIKPEMELFTTAQVHEVYRLIDEGLVDPPYYCNLIFGKGFTVPRPGNLLAVLEDLPDETEWNVLATGPHQLPLTTMGIIMGGHVRVGMEDNLYLRRGQPVESNAQLVERTVEIAELLGREVATPAETRAMLGMD
jgi:3-keto-5-aminohexanoate cleavage enzyme